jgi:hypothetical protein
VDPVFNCFFIRRGREKGRSYTVALIVNVVPTVAEVGETEGAVMVRGVVPI